MWLIGWSRSIMVRKAVRLKVAEAESRWQPEECTLQMLPARGCLPVLGLASPYPAMTLS